MKCVRGCIRPFLSQYSPFLRSRAQQRDFSIFLRKQWPTPQAKSEDSTDPQSSLFSYTSGRYLFNEAKRLEDRHVVFHVAGLKLAAETAVENKHGQVRSLEKRAEGGFNRVFLLTFEDGFELIAKVPYRLAKPDYYTTASEAATLPFLRLKGIPVPHMYGYSPKSDNPVGTEYIFMEKAPGVSLASQWTSLTEGQIRKVTKSFVDIEQKFFQIAFGATGSLYSKKDIPLQLQAPLYSANFVAERPETETFCVGPIADYMFWYGRRASLDLDRGPWTDHVAYLRSIAQKEIEWTRRYGEPTEPTFPHNCLGLGVQDPNDYLRLLDDYKSLTPHLLPKSPSHPFNTPILHHPDLTHSNIFISPKSGEVSCLIDWQHAFIQPTLLAAGYPPAFENPDEEWPTDLEEPRLPPELQTLDDNDKAGATELYRRRLAFWSYRVLNGHFNKQHIAALRDPLLIGRQMLVDRAGRQWSGNLVTLKSTILLAAKFWQHLPDVEGIACPVKIDEEEMDDFAKLEERWVNMNMGVELWRTRLCGMTEDGWVSNEDYEEAKRQHEQLKEEMWQACDDEHERMAFRTGWPWRDHEEIE
ncbi:uncharacterized protein EI97DRAFT_409041 [Westerdykella ornata]|uniref:Aminoglycoside phosphotransferase domain-containing protein n=1 Tax=Westerdykella ornata TaxID=318751 RepID=A0A6A6JX50_WESOR|nr:uncharacterized protein EI97DRAFT_409041 [Westerdykella ornata]KAF2280805.1 hypothetical protein EI97DRAFT_409041 [Westerdykella ornata]